jgi:hypothetical protein
VIVISRDKLMRFFTSRQALAAAVLMLQTAMIAVAHAQQPPTDAPPPATPFTAPAPAFAPPSAPPPAATTPAAPPQGVSLTSATSSEPAGASNDPSAQRLPGVSEATSARVVDLEQRLAEVEAQLAKQSETLTS